MRKGSVMTSKNTALITVGVVVVLAVLGVAAYSVAHKPMASATPSASPSASTAATASSSSSLPTPANQPGAQVPGTVRCMTTGLSATITAAGGAAGTAYQKVVLTNHTKQTCTLTGFPGISLVDGGYNLLGQPATRNGAAGQTVTLAAGKSAASTVAFPNPANFPKGQCSAMSTNMRIYAPDETTYLSPAFQGQWCPGFSVQALVAD